MDDLAGTRIVVGNYPLEEWRSLLAVHGVFLHYRSKAEPFLHY